MHLFDTNQITTDHRSTSTYRLLSSVADRPPRHTPIEYHLATSRFLLGDGLADRLSIPHTSRTMAWRLDLARWIEWSLNAFGRVYLQRWEVERVACTRTIISMIVCWQLGSRRTRFTIKSFGADTLLPQVVEKEGSEDTLIDLEKKGGDTLVGKDNEKVVDPDDDELDPEVQVGPIAGKRIVGRWRWLLLEMAAVVVSPALVVGGKVLHWRWRT